MIVYSIVSLSPESEAFSHSKLLSSLSDSSFVPPFPESESPRLLDIS